MGKVGGQSHQTAASCGPRGRGQVVDEEADKRLSISDEVSRSAVGRCRGEWHLFSSTRVDKIAVKREVVSTNVRGGSVSRGVSARSAAVDRVARRSRPNMGAMKTDQFLFIASGASTSPRQGPAAGLQGRMPIRVESRVDAGGLVASSPTPRGRGRATMCAIGTGRRTSLYRDRHPRDPPATLPR